MRVQSAMRSALLCAEPEERLQWLDSVGFELEEGANLVVSDRVLPQLETLHSRREDAGFTIAFGFLLVVIIIHATRRLCGRPSHSTKRRRIASQGEWARFNGGAENRLTT